MKILLKLWYLLKIPKVFIPVIASCVVVGTITTTAIISSNLKENETTAVGRVVENDNINSKKLDKETTDNMVSEDKETTSDNKETTKENKETATTVNETVNTNNNVQQETTGQASVDAGNSTTSNSTTNNSTTSNSTTNNSTTNNIVEYEVVANATPAENFIYEVVGKEVHITGLDKTKYSEPTEYGGWRYNGSGETIRVPATIDGKPVTSLKIEECGFIGSIYIPSTVSSLSIANIISRGPGECVWTYLDSVEISKDNKYFKVVDNVIYTTDNKKLVMFVDKSVADSFTVPATVEEICNYAFYFCSIKNIILNNGLKKIGDNTFQWSKIETISFPNSVTSIGKAVCYHCQKLVGIITIPKGVTTVPDDMFMYCGSITGVILHERITKIGGNAFRYCVSLADIDLPEGLKRIEGYAFNCTGISEIIIPKAVTYIGSCTFNDTSLTTVKISRNCVIDANTIYEDAMGNTIEVTYYD